MMSLDQKEDSKGPDSPSRSHSRESIKPPPLSRSMVGRYEVIYPLDHGGMASVHVGRLSGMAGFERLVAIKVIHPHMAREKAFVKMFLDEARLAARIHHPNVGEIIEVGEDDGMLYMIGELIIGKNLRSLFRRATHEKVAINNAMIADIGASVCLGLHEAHELTGPNGEPLNLVHRDVSPRNIVISYNGFVKLIDFGVAYARERLSHTDTTSIKGKISFMPPEQIRGESLDRRSDLFSLGVVLYLMVTGVRPFEGSNDAERMNKILNSDFVPPRKVNPRVSPKMEEIILTAMSGVREDRYATAAVMGEDLQSYARMTGAPIGAQARSKLMRELFKEEISKHRQQIQAYREKHGDPAGAASMPAALIDGDAEAHEGADESTRAASPEARRLAEKGVDEISARPRLGRAFGIVLVGVALVVMVALALTLERRNESGPKLKQPVVTKKVDEPEPQTPPVEPGEKETVETPSQKTTVDVVLDITPKEAVVILDGRPIQPGTKQFTLQANSDSHTVEIKAPGYNSEMKTVVADSDKELIVSLQPVDKEKYKRTKPKKKATKSPPGFKKSPYD